MTSDLRPQPGERWRVRRLFSHSVEVLEVDGDEVTYHYVGGFDGLRPVSPECVRSLSRFVADFTPIPKADTP